MSSDPLVPGRECGGCNACCSNYAVSQHQGIKPALTLCPNWNNGCTIYEWRPVPCRTFFCLWRKDASLDDGWRPDRSGVIGRDVISEGPLAGQPGVTFDIMDPAVVGDARFIAEIADRIAAGVPVMLAVAGKQGFGRVLLNDRIAVPTQDAVAAALQAALIEALAAAN